MVYLDQIVKKTFDTVPVLNFSKMDLRDDEETKWRRILNDFDSIDPIPGSIYLDFQKNHLGMVFLSELFNSICDLDFQCVYVDFTGNQELSLKELEKIAEDCEDGSWMVKYNSEYFFSSQLEMEGLKNATVKIFKYMESHLHDHPLYLSSKESQIVN